ncbi:23S rRNA (uracil(1939)-C(5))-methyltransferase RlmD [Acetivibrio sp. MSJd-27]|uniref:23S rRNA (uracil(1939)-C(5))-methyltransferase RlmD n=1 Tax=Acetivibrio sp. MSJd-27 TaxID=2841523 RepID=UPI001C117794|nr:23S rRNA (uracil(1939)-C(5))-methyltransferase RlmD [Acetivibrio sp. MSJd-27]MBU5450267.1 23S rRNA (uracil(1939)-C(5))-methyltransferase RlmD [Acetivibrio sp. MSJd-27]
MKKNEIYCLSVTGTTSEGLGVAKQDGLVIFIQGAIAGEMAEAKILKVKKNIAYAKVEKILTPSASRIRPSCPVFHQCGGCSYLHVSYEKQLEIKRQKVTDCLKRIGKIEFPVSGTLPSPQPFHYRNKVFIPVGKDTNGHIIAGFYAPRSHRIQSADACMIQDRKAQEVINCIKQWMEDFKLPPYDEKTHTGLIRHIYFRVGLSTGQVMAGVSANSKVLPHADILAERLLCIDGVASVIHNVNQFKTNVILGEKTNILAGLPYIEDKILDTRFRIGPLSFCQVNPYQTPRLYQAALDAMDLNIDDVLFDIYCGIGTIGLCAAKRIKKLIGIEIVPEAIEYAKQNALLNDIQNACFFAGKAEEKIFELIDQGEIPTAVVLDPPRAGCDRKLLEAIIRLAPKKLCYISCDPATLARDLNYLAEHSDYQIQSVVPVDMFPQTSHVETVVLMSRCKPDAPIKITPKEAEQGEPYTKRGAC